MTFRKSNNRLQEMGRTMASYGERTGGVNPLNPNTMLTSGSPNGRGIDYSRDPIDPLSNLVDLSNIEALTVNGAPGSTYNVNKSENAFQGMDNNRTFAQKIMDSLSNPAIANIAGMSYTGDKARADKLVNDAENGKFDNAFDSYEQAFNQVN